MMSAASLEMPCFWITVRIACMPSDEVAATVDGRILSGWGGSGCPFVLAIDVVVCDHLHKFGVPWLCGPVGHH